MLETTLERPIDQEFLTVAEFARALRFSPAAIYGAVAAGDLAAVRVSSGPRARIRIPRSELERVCAGGEADLEAGGRAT